MRGVLQVPVASPGGPRRTHSAGGERPSRPLPRQTIGASPTGTPLTRKCSLCSGSLYLAAAGAIRPSVILLGVGLWCVAGCTAETARPEGRPCSDKVPCGPGTTCDPVKHLCVPVTTARPDATRDQPVSPDSPVLDLSSAVDLPQPDLWSPDRFLMPEAGCPTGYASCGSECADLSRNFDHCGGCSQACPRATTDACLSGKCSCGNSGAPCGAGQTCIGGVCRCVAGSLSQCGGCCLGNTCVVPADESLAACGKGGDPCQSCDDGNPCTADQCLAGACSHAALSDGAICGGGTCRGGKCCTGCWDGAACQAAPTASACGVGGALCAQCPAPGGGPCKAATCVAGQCGSGDKADGSGCDDGKFCTVSTTCSAGACGGGSPTDCSDACNTGTCDVTADQCVKTPRQPYGALCAGGTCRKGGCCQTCYDAYNNCLAGTNNNTCGTGGIKCVNCPSSKPTCVNAVCACTGCVYGTTCPAGTTGSRCGINGGPCQVCTAGICQVATCTAGVCGTKTAPDGYGCSVSLGTGACLGGVCCTGCVAGTSCVDLASQTNDLCGSAGAPCVSCTQLGQVCSSGACIL
jgi:hypothetical protein